MIRVIRCILITKSFYAGDFDSSWASGRRSLALLTEDGAEVLKVLEDCAHLSVEKERELTEEKAA